MHLSQMEVFANKLSKLIEEAEDEGFSLIAIEARTPRLYLDLTDGESRTPINTIRLLPPEDAPLYSFLTEVDES
jgi:hypothetical protein